MSEQEPEQTSGEPGSLSAGPAVLHSSDAPGGPVASSAQEAVQEPALASTDIESPSLVPESLIPEQGAAAEMPGAEAPNSDAAEAGAPRIPGKVIIMSSGDRAWADGDAASKPEAGESQGMLGKRRIAALAAVVALAVMAGALGGALATAALTQHVAGDDAATGSNHALDAAVARIDADILALKAGVEHTSKLGMSQFNKTSDRLDKLEKAQAEPAAKIAKLGETVDKLRAAPAAASVPVAAATAAAKDVTGSVSPPATAPKAEVGRLPTVEGWVLRDVSHGGALIEGRHGVYEVYAGDPVPGLGRIDAIRRQDGRWVVVTSKGLIVAR
ncbi:hypothetical protein [Bradyrhizobium sp.]|uniref:hypothetical protein n=1 Tax=Bradyrhizobium sp. TaxID=376 RepID=UPI003C736E12